MLSKAQQHLDSVVNQASASVLRTKQGAIDGTFAPVAGGIDQWQSRAKNRERYALFRGTLYAAVNALSMHAAGQPPVVKRLKGTEKPKGKKAASREMEVAEDHPLVKTLRKPNPFQDGWQFVYMFVSNINLTGRAYVVGDTDSKGNLELYALPTSWVSPLYQDGKQTGWRVGDPNKPQSSHQDLKPEQVVCASLPNPADPRAALAPAESQMPAIRVDDNIWSSREMFFHNGIFPGCIVTVGQNPHPDAGNTGRPMLSSTQRRQVHAAIKKVMGGVANYGNPAIVDGLIESIERLSMTSNEMGWEKSAAETKAAILSAFCVHPYILGEHMPGSMAQAKVIKELFYERVNIFLRMLGSSVTAYLEGMGGDEVVVIEWKPKEFVDEEAQWKRLQDARRNDDVGQNEIREYLGLPPEEDKTENIIGKAAKDVLAVLQTKSQGMIKRSQAVAFIVGMGIPQDKAEAMVGEDEPEPPAQSPSGPGAGPPGGKPSGKPTPGEPPTEAPETPADQLKKAIKYLREAPLDVSGALARRIVKDSAIKHLPGQHNQLSHGRGGSSAPDTGGSGGSGGNTEDFNFGASWAMDYDQYALDGARSAEKQYGRTIAKHLKDKLSDDNIREGEKAAKSEEIDEYRNYGANAVNGLLISGELTRTDHRPDGTEYTKESAKHLIKQLDERLSNAPAIPDDMVLYSGLGSRGGRALMDVKPGEEFTTPSFISTSLNPGYAHTFSHAFESGNKDHAAILRIKTDGKMKGHYLGFGRLKGEEEVLLGRGTKFRVVDVEDRKSKVDWKQGRGKSSNPRPGYDPIGTRYKVVYRVITVEPVYD